MLDENDEMVKNVDSARMPPKGDYFIWFQRPHTLDAVGAHNLFDLLMKLKIVEQLSRTITKRLCKGPRVQKIRAHCYS